MNVLFLSENYASTFSIKRTIIYNRYGTIRILSVKFDTYLFRKTQKWTLFTNGLCGGTISSFQSRSWTEDCFRRNGYAYTLITW